MLAEAIDQHSLGKAQLVKFGSLGSLLKHWQIAIRGRIVFMYVLLATHQLYSEPTALVKHTIRAYLETMLQTRRDEAFLWSWVGTFNDLHIQAVRGGTVVLFVHF